MTAHERARELAAADLDFELAPFERAELDGHLSTCVDCRRFAVELRVDAQALTRLPQVDAPDRVTRAVVSGQQRPAVGRLALLAATLGSVAIAVGVVFGSGRLQFGSSTGAAAPTAPEDSSAPAITAAASQGPAASAEASSPPALQVGGVADVLVTSLRVRTKPDRSASSLRLVPFLSAPRQIAILGGPVTADDYQWYFVAPVDLKSEFTPLNGSANGRPWGWVASESREGEPWIAPAEARCPETPTTMDEIAALEGLTGLVCFTSEPLTVSAVVEGSSCKEPLGGELDPSWFAGDAPAAFVPPSAGQKCGYTPPIDPSAALPEGGLHALNGRKVLVTGVFDHPAARDCVYRPPDGPAVTGPEGAIRCRMAFAVTAIVTD